MLVGSARSAGSQGKRKAWTLAQRFAAKCSGKWCAVCGKSDRSQDPCQPENVLLWAKYEIDQEASNVVFQDEAILKTSLTDCWYCFRVWNACYMVRFPKFSTYRAALLTDRSLEEESDSFRLWVVDQVIRHIEVARSKQCRSYFSVFTTKLLGLA